MDIIYKNSLKMPPNNPRKYKLLWRVQGGRNRHREDKELAKLTLTSCQGSEPTQSQSRDCGVMV